MHENGHVRVYLKPQDWNFLDRLKCKTKKVSVTEIGTRAEMSCVFKVSCVYLRCLVSISDVLCVLKMSCVYFKCLVCLRCLVCT